MSILTLVTHSLSQSELERFAANLSLVARPGFCILLEGDLGAGKSTFARAFIRALAGNASLDVPSPTFSLLQVYDETRVPTAHVDLYRLSTSADVSELGLAELLERHVMLVEWPDRLATELSQDLLTVSLSGAGDRRSVTLNPQGSWLAGLLRAGELEAFLASAGHGTTERRHFDGDASSRRYEILATEPPLVVMDMPERPDGPIVKDNKPYSRIAHLAEGLAAVVAVNSELRARGFSAPEILAYDLKHGFALTEYLGESVYGRMVLAGTDMREPMRAATEVLAEMARQSWPEWVELAAGASHHVAAYDREALLIEVDLLPSWYWPYRNGQPVPQAAADEFTALWSGVLSDLDNAQRVWTLRDYHSPNLMWLPEREGLKRVGLIDTQDCVRGHPAYDLASLLQDARVDIADDITLPLLDHYCSIRSSEPGFDREQFLAAYAILGAQRSTKILGIFARLFKRDGKPAYLKHMPRVARHLKRNLDHPRLAGLKHWFATHLPLDSVT